jgi:hypothetical protein
MKLALGQDIGTVPVIGDSPVAFYRLLVAPPQATAVAALEGVDVLRNTPGIDGIQVNRRPGDPVDSRASSQLNFVVRVDGMVDTHDELNRLVHERISSAISLTFLEGAEPGGATSQSTGTR